MPDPAGTAFTLLSIDFQGAYQVNVAAASERLTMMRYALSLLAAPFAAAVALVSARAVPPEALTSWQQLPVCLFGLLTAFGLLAVLPCLRMIEASITHARTARALNNFRLLYTLELRDAFTAAGWSPNLPVDPAFPDLFSPMSWPGIAAIVLSLLEASEIAVGLAGLVRFQPPLVFVSVTMVTVAAVLFTVYYVSGEISRRGRHPVNPFGFPSVET